MSKTFLIRIDRHFIIVTISHQEMCTKCILMKILKWNKSEFQRFFDKYIIIRAVKLLY